MFSRIIYYITTRVYFLGIRIAALWNPKARKWVAGRRNWQQQLQNWQQQHAGVERVWMHCSSLGEFEQGRPVLEAVKQRYPGIKTIVTFFSPSGYEAVHDKTGIADHICYIPADTKQNARRFIEIVQPSLVLWVRYEYWFHFLNTIHNKKIPALLLSAMFRDEQPFFKWYGYLWLKMLHCFRQVFVRDEDSALAIAEKNIHHVQVAGDTRFDRVNEIAAQFVAVPGITGFCNDNPVVVAGSTWDDDEEELSHYMNTNPGTRFIIAPHEVTESRLRDIEKLVKNSIRYSVLITGKEHTANTLIIDSIGLLSRLYNYATICYVGGGFGNDGVHNVLEAAVYGRPVVFGPVYEKYREAAELIEAGGATSINNALELESVLDDLLQKHDAYINCCEAARKYVFENSGAVKKILGYIQEKRLLTSA
jgi:3-deoxy-D-manno-octulosonic-acid transferase